MINHRELIAPITNHDVFNDSKINDYKAKIIAYLRENDINIDRLSQIPRKQFSDSLVTHYNEKKIRGPANKTWDRVMKYKQTKQKKIVVNDDAITDEANGIEVYADYIHDSSSAKQIMIDERVDYAGCKEAIVKSLNIEEEFQEDVKIGIALDNKSDQITKINLKNFDAVKSRLFQQKSSSTPLYVGMEPETPTIELPIKSSIP